MGRGRKGNEGCGRQLSGGREERRGGEGSGVQEGGIR